MENLGKSRKNTSHLFHEETEGMLYPTKSSPIYEPRNPLGKNVKYLGVMLDTKLCFNDHIPYLIDKINKITRMMYPIINRRSEMNITNKKMIIKSIFHPIMFYCAPVWSTSAKCHLKKLQVVQNKLLKLIYNLPWHYSTQRLHTLANVDLIYDRVNSLTLNFHRKCQISQYSHINDLISS